MFGIEINKNIFSKIQLLTLISELSRVGNILKFMHTEHCILPHAPSDTKNKD